jgi:O-antigen ligase
MIFPDYKKQYYTLVTILAGLMPLYSIRLPIFGIPTTIFEVAVVVVFCLGLILVEVRQSWLHTWRSTPKNIKIAVCIFLLAACISVGISHELHVSLGILKGWFIIPAIFSFLIASASKNNIKLRGDVFSSIIYSGSIVALLGISQLGSVLRIFSIYDVPNSLALFLVPISIISLYRGVQQKNKLYILLSVVMIIAIFATKSFGALFALAGVFIVVALGWIKSSHVLKPLRYIVSWVALSVLFVGLLYMFYFPRIQYFVSPFINPTTHSSLTVRLQLWSIGIRLIAQYPVFGIGLGQFEPAYQAELHREFAEHLNVLPEYVFRDPHNFLISFWLNAGILGLISFLYLNWIAIRSSIKFKSIQKKSVGFALIAMLIFGLVDTIYWKNDLSALWWLLLLWLVF